VCWALVFRSGSLQPWLVRPLSIDDHLPTQGHDRRFFSQYLMAGDDGAKCLQMHDVLATHRTDLTVIRVGTVKSDICLAGACGTDRSPG